MFQHLTDFCETKLPSNSPWCMTPRRHPVVCARYPQVLGCAGPQTHARKRNASYKDGTHEERTSRDFMGPGRLILCRSCRDAYPDFPTPPRVSTAFNRTRNRSGSAKPLFLQMLLLRDLTNADMTPDTALSKGCSRVLLHEHSCQLHCDPLTCLKWNGTVWPLSIPPSSNFGGWTQVLFVLCMPSGVIYDLSSPSAPGKSSAVNFLGSKDAFVVSIDASFDTVSATTQC